MEQVLWAGPPRVAYERDCRRYRADDFRYGGVTVEDRSDSDDHAGGVRPHLPDDRGRTTALFTRAGRRVT
jgi:hypothetical protein